MKLMARSAAISITVLFCFYIGIVLNLYGETPQEDNVRADELLIAPGIGSQSILIGDSIDMVIQKSGREKFKISKPAARGDLFKDVFHVATNIQIAFDSLYYSENNNYTLCVSRGRVVAIIGFNNTGITIEGVSLKSGINNFIFNYGNNNVIRIQSGSNDMYIYHTRGIAVIDDDMNDTIDLYIVFSPKVAK